MLKKYTDANGNEIEVDDEVSLIAGHPELKPPSTEAATPRILPRRYEADKKGEPMNEKNWRNWTPQPEVKHAGNSGLNSPERLEMMRKAEAGTLRDQETERKIRDGEL